MPSQVSWIQCSTVEWNKLGKRSQQRNRFAQELDPAWGGKETRECPHGPGCFGQVSSGGQWWADGPAETDPWEPTSAFSRSQPSAWPCLSWDRYWCVLFIVCSVSTFPFQKEPQLLLNCPELPTQFNSLITYWAPFLCQSPYQVFYRENKDVPEQLKC